MAGAAGREPLKVHLRHESVHQLLKRSSREQAVPLEEQYDYIYCAGLFDYLADKACARLIAYFDRHLRPGAHHFPLSRQEQLTAEPGPLP